MSNSNKFSSPLGLSTRKWGPGMWHSLFSSIMGAYPYKIEENNKMHIQIRNEFKNLFSSLQYTLPCCFCQESYRNYWLELPIDEYLSGRVKLMEWLYKIKDKVNKKLIAQETERFKAEKIRINNIYKKKDITRANYDKLIDKLKDKLLYTQKSPPFQSVLNYYESKRA
jgi:hypothetical protein